MGPSRRQRIAAWAGEIGPGLAPQAGILHMAPVASEIAAGSWPRAEFVGLTPQGLVRRWDGPGSPVELGPVTPEQEALGELLRRDGAQRRGA